MISLDQLCGQYWGASKMKRGASEAVVLIARKAFADSPDLEAEARTELGRLEKMKEPLERRCIISANRRDFLREVLKETANGG